MPSPFEHSRSRRKGVLGQWLPLAVTVTAVTLGIAAWIWSERRETDNDEDDDQDAETLCRSEDDRKDRLDARNRGTEQARYVQDNIQDAVTQSDRPVLVLPPNDTLYARVTDVVRRTPSPQQILGNTGRRMAASVGAAFGLGKTLDFKDHEAWQEEAEMSAAAALVGQEEQAAPSRWNDKQDQGILAGFGPGIRDQKRVAVQKKNKTSTRRRVTVAVVSAAGSTEDAAETTAGQSIIAKLSTQSIDPEETDLLILIYGPHLKASDTSETTAGSAEAAYDNLYSHALTLVPNAAHIIPFSVPTSVVHLLRHLAPQLVYIQEDLAGVGGEHLLQIKGWVGRVVLVANGSELDPEARG